MTGLAPLLETLPRWTLVGGKGGVGKTTCAAALASASARRGDRTLLVSTDPACSLADALGVALGSEPRPVPARPGLDAFQLDAARARDAFLDRWRDTLITIVDRGTYLEPDDIAGLIDSALPGADEAMALLTFADLEQMGTWRRIIVDTAPTGHTLRLLALPATFRALIELLDTMQGKHRFMVAALTHRYRSDAADAFLDTMRARLEQLAAVLHDPRRAGLLLVTRAESVVAAETVRFLEALPALGLAATGVVVNALGSRIRGEGADALTAIVAAARERALRITTVPVLAEPPIGLDAIDAWGEAAREMEVGEEVQNSGEASRPASARADDGGRAWLESLDRAALRARPFTIVGGKGGVGKTSVACALALCTARVEGPVFIVSTDPAPSVADALAQPVGDSEVEITGAVGVVARQMDAAAAFQRMRTAYTERIDKMFDSLVGSGMDAAHDRRILRDLLALAPPGIDELYALASLGATLAEERHAVVIVDPAPTGHLLRLIEMPAVALEWSHRLMRLMLKYRELVALGDAAEELLAFARRTRALGELLQDPARAGLLVVALDEPLVRAETARLIEAARARGLDVMGVLWNRASRRPPPLALPLTGGRPPSQFVGEVVDPPPRGVDALRAWGAAWRVISEEHG